MLVRARQIGLAFLAATLVTAVAASVCSTQFVIAALVAVNVEIPFGVRLSMTFTDLHILRMLLPAAIACLLPAFIVAEQLSRFVGGRRDVWFAVAGGTAFLAELLIIEAVLGLMPIGGARSGAGMAMQGVAGVLGGIVYARLSATPVSGEGG
jgi:hypothetical protein